MTRPTGEGARAYRRYSEALYAALRDDPFYAALERAVPDPAASREAMLVYYDHSILEAATHGLAVFPEEGTFGVSVWTVPMAPEQQRDNARAKKQVIARRMGEACLRTYAGICDAMAENSAPLISGQDWYLSILGLLPEFQGQGRGAGLIEPVLEQADRAGVATYLETFTPGNMPFYRRLGYREAGGFREPVTDSDYWVMRRQPAG